MDGLSQRQSDAIFEVMALYQGFVKRVAAGDCDGTEQCLHCQAEAVHERCRVIITGPKAA